MDMKKTLLGTVVCLGALMGTASAQMIAEMKVTLPEAASVGGVTLPAGEYTIRDLRDDGNAVVLQISAFNGKSVDAMAQAVDVHHANQSGIVLKQSGEGYRIQSIQFAGDDTAYEFLTK
jgi:hypothetical protein